MASPAQAPWHVAQEAEALGKVFGMVFPKPLAEQGLLNLAQATFTARGDMLRPFAHSKESALFQAAIYLPSLISPMRSQA